MRPTSAEVALLVCGLCLLHTGDGVCVNNKNDATVCLLRRSLSSARTRQHWFLTSPRFHFVPMFALRSVYREDSSSVGIGEAEATCSKTWALNQMKEEKKKAEEPEKMKSKQSECSTAMCSLDDDDDDD